MRAWLLQAMVVLIGCGDAATPSTVDSDSDTDVVSVGAVVADPLASDDFAFCHEGGTDADQVARWCKLLEAAPRDVCPGMRATCDAGDFSANKVGCELDGSATEGAFAGAPDKVDDPWRRMQGCGAQTPALADGILRWSAALSVAVLIAVLLRYLWRTVGWGRGDEPEQPAEADVAAVEHAIEGDDDLPALPETELLALARQAMLDGRLGEAVVYARGAALRRLARRGLLVLHRARTDREYLRTLRVEPTTQAALEDVLRAAEDHRFAGRVLSPQTAQAAVDAAGRLLAGMLLVLLCLPASEAWAGRRHAPDGDAALVRLLDEAGYERVRDGGWLGDVDERVDVVLLDLDGVRPAQTDWEALEGWVLAGGVLVLAAPPYVDAGPFRGALGDSSLFIGAEGDLATRGFARQAGLPPPRYPGQPTYQWCGGEGLPLVVLPAGAPRLDESRDRINCHAPRIVELLPWGEGRVIALADATILHNAALMVEDNRVFLAQLLPAGRDDGSLPLPARPRILVATSGSASAPPSPLSSIANARLLPFVLQLFAFWTLLAMWRGWSLVPAHDPPVQARADFGEHAAALGRHWETLGATRHAAAAYGRLVLARLGPRGLAQALVRQGRSVADARAFVAQVEGLVAQPDGDDDPSDRQLVEALWSTMTGSRPR